MAHNPTTFADLVETEELAFLLFTSCYGLTLPSAFDAARRMLPTLRTFAAEWDAAAEAAQALYTAPLNGKQPAGR